MMGHETFWWPLAWLLITIGLYALSRALQKRTRSVWANPVLLPVITILTLIQVGQIPSSTFRPAGELLMFFLGPTVVALGVKLYEQKEALKIHWKRVMLAIAAGSLTGVLSGWGISMLMGSPEKIAMTMATRSVTAPIAMAICKANGGLAELAAITVIFTGIFGAVFGHAWMRLTGVKGDLAIGLAMGTAAHGIGTAKAMQEHDLQGAFAGLAFGLAGIFTSVWVPVLSLLWK